MKKQLSTSLVVLLFIMPLIDLVTSLMTRFFPNVISLGIVVKGLLSLVCVIYVFFFSKNKYRKPAIISYVCTAIFVILYLLTKYRLTEFTFLFKEIVYIFKYFYVFVIFWGIINIFTDTGVEKKTIEKIMIVNLLIYVIVFLLSTITNTGFSSYLDNNGGISGWFYAANEVGATVTILFPIIYIYFKDKKNYLFMLLMVPVGNVLSAMGTKVSLLGFAINLGIISLFYILKNYKSFKRLILLAIIIVSSLFIITHSVGLSNAEQQVEDKINNVVQTPTTPVLPDNSIIDNNVGQTTNNPEGTISDTLTNPSITETPILPTIKKDKIIEFIRSSKYIKLIFNQRESFFINTYSIYKKSNCIDKLLGLGFNNRDEINNLHIEKLIEIDVLDIFFHFGLIGFLLYFVQLLYILYLVFIRDCNNKDKVEKTISLIEILLIGGISSIAGHVLGAPAVSIYIVYYLLINVLPIPEEKIKKNKIDILALHLNYGGVESSIASQANALCDDYEVEIICTYKMTDKPVFDIDDRVKITYLTNVQPNKQEFLTALKERKVFRILREGLKSVKVLSLKKYKNIEAIKHSNAGIIISSRVGLTHLLRKYKKQNVITITEEHAHHNNNKKYINRLKKACRGIDYLVCVSKELTDFYSKEIPNTKSIYIPNGLDYTPNKLSKLNNKKLISVGRLSPEKGYLDLIDVFNEIHKLDKNYTLDIIGDGVERKAIQNKINALKLEKNITLHGFQKKDFINEKLLDSSLYLMCSHEESFGIVLIEAGSFGVPQIAFDSAQGAHEIIEDNKSGYLIKNRNAKEFAKKANELINDKEKLKKFGKEANKVALEFSFDNIKTKWLEFIKLIQKH